MSARPRNDTLEEIYRACAPVALRRARQILGTGGGEEWDLVHDVFVSCARPGLAERIREDPMPFVYRAVTNACLNELEARRVRAAPLPPRPESVETGPAAHARELLVKLGDRLDATDKQLLVLAFYDGLSQEEIARVLGIWRRTVGRRLLRLRRLAGEVGGGAT